MAYRYHDIETDEIVTEEQLKKEYQFQLESGTIDEMTFAEYVHNSLTTYNGALEIIY